MSIHFELLFFDYLFIAGEFKAIDLIYLKLIVKAVATADEDEAEAKKSQTISFGCKENFHV